MVELLSIISSLLLILMYIIYFKQVTTGESTPNPASWLSWALASTINSITYFAVVEGDYLKSSIAIIANVSMIGICIYSFSQKKFSKLNTLDIIILTSTVLIGIIWQLTQDDRLANILIQFVFVISFIPTFYGLLINTLTEKPLPWWLTVASYSFSIVAILINFNGDWLELLFPVANGIIGNGLIAVLATIKNVR